MEASSGHRAVAAVSGYAKPEPLRLGCRVCMQLAQSFIANAVNAVQFGDVTEATPAFPFFNDHVGNFVAHVVDRLQFSLLA